MEKPKLHHLIKRGSGILFLLALLLPLSCGNNDPEPNQATETSSETAQTISAEETQPSGEPQEILSIRNPNPIDPEGAPRPPEEVQKDRQLGKELTLRVPEYLKDHGLRKTVAELNKGRSGELGDSMPESHFYCSFANNKGNQFHWQIIAHATLPAAIGYDIPDLGMVKDNTGWAYNKEMQTALDAQGKTLGEIQELIWTDPKWSSLSCRMTAFYHIIEYQGESYILYCAYWLDQ